MATVSGSGEDSQITSLWHRCLGHAVEVVSKYSHDLGKGHWLQVVKADFEMGFTVLIENRGCWLSL